MRDQGLFSGEILTLKHSEYGEKRRGPFDLANYRGCMVGPLFRSRCLRSKLPGRPYFYTSFFGKTSNTLEPLNSHPSRLDPLCLYPLKLSSSSFVLSLSDIILDNLALIKRFTIERTQYLPHLQAIHVTALSCNKQTMNFSNNFWWSGQSV